MNKLKKTILHSVWIICMSVLAFIVLYPLIYSLLAGFNTLEEFTDLGDIFPVPEKFTMFNYAYGFSKAMSVTLVKTVLRTAYYVLIVVGLSVLNGYVLARYEFKMKKLFIVYIVVAQVIPSIMYLIPTFVMVSKLPLLGGNDILGRGGHGLYNNPIMLYLPFGAGNLMWTFLFMQSMKGLSASFEEAAEIDGCGFWRTVLHVVLPMQKPMLSVIAVNVALGTWNDWLTPFMYLNDTSKATLPAYLATLTTRLQEFGTRDYPKIFALATVAIIPPMIIFLFLQKYIVEGIASAGVKE